MAIAPTGTIYKALIFDGESSRDYGVYITGEAVYNAPERAVEMISIPNKDGAFALDKGYFENIEVKYPAGMFAATEAEFSAAISDFRNMLCSRKGYVRLEDEYHPDEYRMAIYKSGLEVDPAKAAGEFEIIFDCMPQRFLKSGEEAVSVSDGDILDNPTLFEASPLIETEGYGTISFNGYEIELLNSLMGNVELQHDYHSEEEQTNNPFTEGVPTFWDRIPVSAGIANNGDTITATMIATLKLQIIGGARSFGTPTNIRVTDESGTTITDVDVTAKTVNNKQIECKFVFPVNYAFGNTQQGTKYNLYFTITPTDLDGGTAYGTFECHTSVKFWRATLNGQLVLIADVATVTTSGTNVQKAFLRDYTVSYINLNVKNVYVNSTVPARGNPTYIDCFLGMAYKEVDGERISLNKYVRLGAQLPKLKSGDNEISIDAFTDVTIIPRWSKI